jgi:hypothetical protein
MQSLKAIFPNRLPSHTTAANAERILSEPNGVIVRHKNPYLLPGFEPGTSGRSLELRPLVQPAVNIKRLMVESIKLYARFGPEECVKKFTWRGNVICLSLSLSCMVTNHAWRRRRGHAKFSLSLGVHWTLVASLWLAKNWHTARTPPIMLSLRRRINK